MDLIAFVAFFLFGMYIADRLAVRYKIMSSIPWWVGYYFVPVEPFETVGNVLFIAAVFGLFAGLLDFTGFFGNVVNAFLFVFPVYFLAPGGWVVVWVGGNVGYTLGNVFGQLARLSIKVGVRSI